MTKNITSESFNRLLDAFSSDKTEAGLAYSKLRDSLVRFFEIKGDLEPNEAADATIDRVVLKLSEINEIDDLTRYSFGVARFIFLERLRSVEKEKIAAKGFYSDIISMKTEIDIDEFEPLRGCLEKLPTVDKNILEIYFADVPHSKLIEHREKLSNKINITLNNLRIKVFRLRQSLAKCVKNKLNR